MYETVINGIAVMRRRADSWLNATQILKVAGVDKGKRTKVLEKEILAGEHEKVQGGTEGTKGPGSITKEPEISAERMASKICFVLCSSTIWDRMETSLETDCSRLQPRNKQWPLRGKR